MTWEQAWLELGGRVACYVGELTLGHRLMIRLRILWWRKGFFR